MAGGHVSSARKTSLYAGLWFIGTFVFAIPGALLYDPLLNDEDYILGSGSDTQVEFGALLEILTAVAGIATAVVLYRIVRRASESVAIGYVALRIVESLLIIMGVISVLTVVTLRQEFAEGGADPASLTLAGESLIAFHDWTSLFGPQFCAGFGNGLLLGYLMYKSGLVPRGMAMLGLIGGPLAVLGGILVLLEVIDRPSGPLILLTIPEVLWEASLGIYLTWKGFRPSPILSAEELAPRTA